MLASSTLHSVPTTAGTPACIRPAGRPMDSSGRLPKSGWPSGKRTAPPGGAASNALGPAPGGPARSTGHRPAAVRNPADRRGESARDTTGGPVHIRQGVEQRLPRGLLFVPRVRRAVRQHVRDAFQSARANGRLPGRSSSASANSGSGLPTPTRRNRVAPSVRFLPGLASTVAEMA